MIHAVIAKTIKKNSAGKCHANHTRLWKTV